MTLVVAVVTAAVVVVIVIILIIIMIIIILIMIVVVVVVVVVVVAVVVAVVIAAVAAEVATVAHSGGNWTVRVHIAHFQLGSFLMGLVSNWAQFYAHAFLMDCRIINYKR